MKIDILTIFPEMFSGPFSQSIIRRAVEKKLADINVHNLRKWAKDKRKTVDDRPFGGGTGMVMMVGPIDSALQEIKKKDTIGKKKNSGKDTRVILLTPAGKVFNQDKAKELSRLSHLILICGHYEGIDERVSQYLADEEISIGDYILTGGEIPAMLITDAVVRLIPGVLDKKEATSSESFSNLGLKPENLKLLEYPQYTQPADYRGWKVPDILLSGNHKMIEEWRKKMAMKKTKATRPDLLEKIKLP